MTGYDYKPTPPDGDDLGARRLTRPRMTGYDYKPTPPDGDDFGS